MSSQGEGSKSEDYRDWDLDPNDPESVARAERRAEREARRSQPRSSAAAKRDKKQAEKTKREWKKPQLPTVDWSLFKRPDLLRKARVPLAVVLALLVIWFLVQVLGGDSESEVKQAATVKVLIPEGKTRREIATIARKLGVRGNYIKASESSKLLNPKRYGAERTPRSLEGFLFPATYELIRGQRVNSLVRRQLAAFKATVKKVDMSYAKSRNLTIYDVLIIASMIEREVQLPKERRLVAAVIYNRLRKQMHLGIDATVRYATGNWTRPLSSRELNSKSPYNTRTRVGLPPTPIGNPGLAAIKAAARPARVGYLYYVVKPDGCGEHAFSSSEQKFLRDSRRYQRARKRSDSSLAECD